MSDEQVRRDAIDDACEKWFSKVEVSVYTGVEVKHAVGCLHRKRDADGVKKMSDSSLQRLQTELRETPLRERMRNSCGRIGEMCADGRPPRMSIPVRAVDDDFYICTTIRDAEDEIDRLTAELAECKKDAERYRWLCASDWYIGPEPQGDTNVVSLYNENTDNDGLNLSKEIDAAMESKNDNT